MSISRIMVMHDVQMISFTKNRYVDTKDLTEKNCHIWPTFNFNYTSIYEYFQEQLKSVAKSKIYDGNNDTGVFFKSVIPFKDIL